MTRHRGLDHASESRRREMVERLAERRDLSPSTLSAVRAVPRHEFVPEDRWNQAYDDRPLPIGDGQTVSAPHMVAVMLDVLDLARGERVLEVGTGCGYHAAVTAEVVGAENVLTVEYGADLAVRARDRLARLGYGDVSVRTGDGWVGWPEHATYDAAYLTCAVPTFPEAVVEQVSSGGRLLGPLGEHEQTLVMIRVRPDGGLDREEHGAVRFVRIRN
jgi:protein-L-isoaspartate(D-aspartate) O-methyltransferase